jgi:hypothetical protein
MSHLGAVLSMQGKYVEVEQMHRQTLELGQKVPGLPCRYCKDFSIGSTWERDYESYRIRKGKEYGKRLPRVQLGYNKRRTYFFQGLGCVEMKGDSGTSKSWIRERGHPPSKSLRDQWQYLRKS